MESELLSLKWNNHRTTFLHVIGTLRSKASYTDATLACDGKFYPVHKLVLSTCSEYFGAIFERTPCKSPVVVLKDIECKNLEFLLDYMYIGEVNVRQNELAALIKAAECLKIKGLAVPDEEPSVNTFPKNIRSDSQRESSPPAKRRRNVQSGSDLEGKRDSSETTIDSLRLEKGPSKDIGECSLDDGISPIKLEPLDDAEVSNFITNSNSTGVNNEKISDEGGGGCEGSKEDSNADIKEFFNAKVESEESVQMSEYSSSEFAGPSGVQNSNLSQWDSENSFPMDHLLAGSSSTQLETQQQQQQQLLEAGAPFEAALRKYPSAIKDCFVVLSPNLPRISVTPSIKRARRKRGNKWSRGKISCRKSVYKNNNGERKENKKYYSKKEFQCSEVLKHIKKEPDDDSYTEVLKHIKKEPEDDNPVDDSCSSLRKSKRVVKSPPLKIKYEDSEDTEDSTYSETGPKYGNFQCFYCPYTTKFKKCLRKHHQNKHSKSSVQNLPSIEYSCPHCSSAHKNKEELRSHIKAEHSDVKPYACSQCFFCSTKIRSLKAHINYMHCDNGFRRKFECNKCFFSSNAKSTLRKHLQTRHNKEYSCSKCTYKCHNQSTLNEHESMVHPHPSSSYTDHNHNPDNSGMTHSSENELPMYLPNIIPNIKNEVELFTCKDCNFETESFSVLEEHQDIEHSQGIKIKKVFSIKKEPGYLF